MVGGWGSPTGVDGRARLLVFNQMLELKKRSWWKTCWSDCLADTGLGFHVALVYSAGPSWCFIEGLQNPLFTHSGEVLTQAAQRGCGCPIPGGVSRPGRMGPWAKYYLS